MKYVRLFKAILEINDDMSKKDILESLSSIKNEVSEILNEKSKKNQDYYSKDLEKSRLKKKVNNSRQAIKKYWDSRSEKKEYIKSHIKILRDIKNSGFIVNSSPEKKIKKEYVFPKQKKKIDEISSDFSSNDESALNKILSVYNKAHSSEKKQEVAQDESEIQKSKPNRQR